MSSDKESRIWNIKDCDKLKCKGKERAEGVVFKRKWVVCAHRKIFSTKVWTKWNRWLLSFTIPLL